MTVVVGLTRRGQFEIAVTARPGGRSGSGALTNHHFIRLLGPRHPSLMVHHRTTLSNDGPSLPPSQSSTSRTSSRSSHCDWQQREDRPVPPHPQYTPPPWLPHVTPTYLPPAMWPEVVISTMNWLKFRDMFYDFSVFLSVTQQALAMSSFQPVYCPTPCAPVSTFA